MKPVITVFQELHDRLDCVWGVVHKHHPLSSLLRLLRNVLSSFDTSFRRWFAHADYTLE